MNVEVACEIHNTRHGDKYDLETYLAKLREGLALARQRQKQRNAGPAHLLGKAEKEKLELALEYNEVAMLRFLLKPN